jgi:tRNA(Ile)-lysidine synthase
MSHTGRFFKEKILLRVPRGTTRDGTYGALPPTDDPCVRAVGQTIERWGLAAAGPDVLVGVSGGGDSVALLYILQALAGRFHLRLAIAHLDHGLRGAAARRDALFVAQLGAQLGLPVHRQEADIRRVAREGKLSLEEAGRLERLRFFRSLAADEGFTGVALGHHADDNAELVLMRLLRGSGSLGLAGMAPQRPLMDQGPLLIRPLIERRRWEVRAFLRRCGLVHTDDASNRDPRFLRNRIRHHLLPILRADYQPSVEDVLLRQAELFRAEEDWLQGVAAAELERIRLREEAAGLDLDAVALQACPEALQRRILREALRRLKGDLRRVSFQHIEALRAMLFQAAPSARVALPDGLQARCSGGALCLERGSSGRVQTETAAFRYLLPAPGAYAIPEAGAHMSLAALPDGHASAREPAGQHEAFFDMDKLSFPLVVRNFQAGDRFQPLGVNGTQKLKKYFIDHKVARAERYRCPLLVSNQQIVWVVGHRTSEAAKVDPGTRRVLRAVVGLPAGV